MNKIRWEIKLGVLLVLISFVFYALHYSLFHDLHHIFLYLVGDIAFLPIDVLLVILVLERILSAREKKIILEKMNMVIGSFFSEAGFNLLAQLSRFDEGIGELRAALAVRNDWRRRDYTAADRALRRHGFLVDSRRGDLAALKTFIIEERTFLLKMLENPTLLEHEKFTDLLWAVFHLADELSRRDDLSRLPVADHDHLSGDIKRVYVLLTSEWLDYLQHLQRAYPYLFSLALRTNPFDPEARVVIS